MDQELLHGLKASQCSHHVFQQITTLQQFLRVSFNEKKPLMNEKNNFITRIR